VTAKDGSYYLGEVKPGTYWVLVEEKGLPLEYTIQTPRQPVTMESGEEDPVTRNVDFVVVPARAEGKPASVQEVAHSGPKHEALAPSSQVKE
jgi:hypothetical protein